MRKEVLFAISIGFLLGLVITFGIYRANRAIKERAGSEKNPEVASQPPSPIPHLPNLKIFQPENNLVVYDDEIMLQGESDPELIISILSEDDQQTIFQTGKEGTFSAKIKLISGANEIKVISFDSEGKKVEENLTIILSSTKIEP